MTTLAPQLSAVSGNARHTLSIELFQRAADDNPANRHRARLAKIDNNEARPRRGARLLLDWWQKAWPVAPPIRGTLVFVLGSSVPTRGFRDVFHLLRAVHHARDASELKQAGHVMEGAGYRDVVRVAHKGAGAPTPKLALVPCRPEYVAGSEGLDERLRPELIAHAVARMLLPTCSGICDNVCRCTRGHRGDRQSNGG